jgi:transposase InsO family protein
MMESFFGTLQLELLHEHHWDSLEQLASAIFEWIEGWYSPTRRHTSIGELSPAAFETLHESAAIAA